MANHEIKTARIGDRLIVTNGVDPLAYIDLTKVNKGNKSQAVVRFKAFEKAFKVTYTVAK